MFDRLRDTAAIVAVPVTIAFLFMLDSEWFNNLIRAMGAY